MTVKIRTGPTSATPPVPEQPKLLDQLLDAWHDRVTHLEIKRDTVTYMRAQQEFWLGTLATAEFLGQPLSPIVPIYLMSGRDLLTLRKKVDA